MNFIGDVSASLRKVVIYVDGFVRRMKVDGKTKIEENLLHSDYVGPLLIYDVFHMLICPVML